MSKKLKPMKKPFLLGVTVLILVLAGCDQLGKETAETAPQQAPALQKVSVVKTEKRLVQPQFEFPATIEAMETASIRSQVAAIVIARHSTPGALVKKGDLLVELDASEYIAAEAEAKAAQSEAQANLSQAAAKLERAEALKPKGHISAQEYDQIKANADIARAQVARSEAALVRAQLDMRYTNIYAPFDGKISAASFSVGDFVMPASPVQPSPLYELVKLNPIYAITHIDLKVYDNFILKRLELKKLGIDIPPVELEINLPNGILYPYKGTFENWDHQAAENSGSIAARIVFENPDGLLLPGHNMTLIGRVLEKLERIMIPQKSVSMDQQGHYVFVVEDGVVARNNIIVGVRDGADWAIIEGLEPGVQVVVDGLQKVRPGDPVSTFPYSSTDG